MMKKKSVAKKSMVYLLLIIAVAVIAVFLFFAITGIREGSNEDERQRLEAALQRAAISCYTIEGYFPPTLEYLVEEYGVQINEEKFAVYYNIEGSNMMPTIDVIFK